MFGYSANRGVARVWSCLNNLKSSYDGKYQSVHSKIVRKGPAPGPAAVLWPAKVPQLTEACFIKLQTSLRKSSTQFRPIAIQSSKAEKYNRQTTFHCFTK